MAHRLTELQARIFEFVRSFEEQNRVPPSSRKVAEFLKRSQPTSVKHLQALARKGHLEKLPDGRWGVKNLSDISQATALPIYGTIPAGVPTAKDQECEGTVAFDPTIFGVRATSAQPVWLLRVSGDSMTGAGIEHGDLAVMVRRDPQVGDIIAALADETGATLKTVAKVRGRIALRAANPKYKDIFPAHLETQGVMVGLIRRLARGQFSPNTKGLK